MSAKSKSQQRLFGMVHACQKKGECASNQIKKIAKSISKKDAKELAETKHKGLPNRIKKKKKKKMSFKEYFEWREREREGINENIC